MYKLNSDISILKSIGMKTKNIFNDHNISTIKDLLYLFPKCYNKEELNTLENGKKIILKGTVSSRVSLINIKNSKNNIVFNIECNNKEYKIQGQGFSHLIYELKKGSNINILGRYIESGNYISLEEVLNDDFITIIEPKYNLNNIKDSFITLLEENILNDISLKETIPKTILDKNNLLGINDYIHHIHFPKDELDIIEVLKRRNYETYFNFFIDLLKLDLQLKSSINNSKFFSLKLYNDFKLNLNKPISSNLNNICLDIIKTIHKEDYKRRIIGLQSEDDKAIFMSLLGLIYFLNNFQTLIICSSIEEAKNKFKKISNILNKYRIDVQFIDDTLPSYKLNELYRKIDLGYIDIIISTSSIFEKSISLPKLDLIISEKNYFFNIEEEFKLIDKFGITDVVYLSNDIIPKVIEDEFGFYKTYQERINIKDIFLNTNFIDYKCSLDFLLNDNEKYIIVCNKTDDFHENYFKKYNINHLYNNETYYDKKKTITDFLNDKFNILLTDFNVFKCFTLKGKINLLFYTQKELKFIDSYTVFNDYNKGNFKAKSYLVSPKSLINKLKRLSNNTYLDECLNADFSNENISKYIFDLPNISISLNKKTDLNLFKLAFSDAKNYYNL